MIVAVKKTGGETDHFHGALALKIWRAFRSSLWERGVKRDPIQGDEIDGIRIVALSV